MSRKEPIEPLVETETRQFRIAGRVQGVGFRPFVKRLADAHQLGGWVKNEASHVSVLATGRPDELDRFEAGLITKAPPLARPNIQSVTAQAPGGHSGFSILESKSGSSCDAELPPDCFLCADCLAEINDPLERRYRYPFTNCTQCGPRYTIIAALPYDRASTSMAAFDLCQSCRHEFENQLDRRFHAQPLACPDCGPQLLFKKPNGEEISGNAPALAACVDVLRDGLTVAVRGVGGYHLMCDAASEKAVLGLRDQKRRPDKPFAVMVPAGGNDPLVFAGQIAHLDAIERAALCDPVRPIVLVRRRSDAPIADAVAPGLGEVGLMLPYSPLHHLILGDFGGALVATSGNISGEPVIIDPHEAEVRLGQCCDAFLHHDRPIQRPADDPVWRVMAGRARSIRLGRGSAPITLPNLNPSPDTVLACGGQLKATVALGIAGRVVVSPHLGDMGTLRSLTTFEQVAEDLQKLYGTRAATILHDAHPDFTTTRWALRQETLAVGIEHHTAHASALAGEHGCTEGILVFTWDGLGLGPDGSLWGGETFYGSPGSWRRVGSLRPFRLIGGDRVPLEPWRSGCSLSLEANHPWQALHTDTTVYRRAWAGGAGILSSSVGRLFDAAAAFVGLVERCTYDGQAPAMIESASGEINKEIALPIRPAGETRRIDWAPLVPMLLDTSLPVAQRLGKFHGALSATLVAEALYHGPANRTNIVGLTGGVFQNRLLTEHVTASLKENGFEVLLHERIPMNDGGLSFGQVIEFSARKAS